MEIVNGYLNMFPICAAFTGIPAIPAETCPDSAGMTSEQIYLELVRQVGPVGTITRVAEQIGVDRDRVSATIYYHRVNTEVRKKLQAKYGVKFSKRTIRLNQQRKLKKAA